MIINESVPNWDYLIDCCGVHRVSRADTRLGSAGDCKVWKAFACEDEDAREALEVAFNGY